MMNSTGASGVQLVQNLAPLALELTLFQRTPNLALPMKQVEYPGAQTPIPKEEYPALYEGRLQSFGGLGFNFMNKSTFEDSPEQRRETYEKLWAHGDFRFWLATYGDMLFSEEANTEAYAFW